MRTVVLNVDEVHLPEVQALVRRLCPGRPDISESSQFSTGKLGPGRRVITTDPDDPPVRADNPPVDHATDDDVLRVLLRSVLKDAGFEGLSARTRELVESFLERDDGRS